MENDRDFMREVENALHVDIVPGTEIMAQDGCPLHPFPASSTAVLMLVTMADSGGNPLCRKRGKRGARAAALEQRRRPAQLEPAVEGHHDDEHGHDRLRAVLWPACRRHTGPAVHGRVAGTVNRRHPAIRKSRHRPAMTRIYS